MKLLIVLLLCLSSTAKAGDWSDTDRYRETAYLALHVVDWTQTRYIAKNPDRFKENNRILGEHPTLGNVNRYFIAAGIGHFVIASALSGEWRYAFQAVTITVRMRDVVGNHRIGIEFAF